MNSLVRPLTSPEDQLAFQKIMTIAFCSSRDYSQFTPRTPEELEQDPSKVWGVGNPPTSGFVVIDFDTFFDGHIVKTTGIGGVASLPEARNGGGIRAIFEALMPRWYQEGVVFSTLYPFSHEFYGKFGYSFCQDWRVYTIQMEALTPLVKAYGRTNGVLMTNDIAVLKPISEGFGNKHNLYIRRKDSQWNQPHQDPYRDKMYTYAKEGQFFITFKPEMKTGDDLYTMIVRDLAYTSPKGFLEMLLFLYELRAQYGAIEIPLPSDVPVRHLIKEPYEVKEFVSCRGMARVVNVKKALELMKYPDDTGSFSVRVADPIIPENNGIFQVTFAQGKAEKVTRNNDCFFGEKAAPVNKDDMAITNGDEVAITDGSLLDVTHDLAMSINDLSRLVTGAISLKEAAYLPDIHWSNEALKRQEELYPIFPGKSIFFMKGF